MCAKNLIPRIILSLNFPKPGGYILDEGGLKK